jgi:xanthine dehydrogenase accessory factor
VKQYLADAGIGGVETVRNPAGIDLGARSAPEVALSILAEIVKAHPDGTRMATAAPNARPAAASPAPATAVDPVCGMSVAVASARHTAELDGVTYYFCCASCRGKFVDAPGAYPAHS